MKFDIDLNAELDKVAIAAVRWRPGRRVVTVEIDNELNWIWKSIWPNRRRQENPRSPDFFRLKLTKR